MEPSERERYLANLPEDALRFEALRAVPYWTKPLFDEDVRLCREGGSGSAIASAIFLSAQATMGPILCILTACALQSWLALMLMFIGLVIIYVAGPSKEGTRWIGCTTMAVLMPPLGLILYVLRTG